MTESTTNASRRKIAIAGKGGSGKTTVAGVLARSIARRGHEVWAIDADSNPNLAVTLGLAADRIDGIEPIPRSVLEETMEDGKRKLALGVPAAEIASRYGTSAPDNVRLLLMGRVDHAGAG